MMPPPRRDDYRRYSRYGFDRPPMYVPERYAYGPGDRYGYPSDRYGYASRNPSDRYCNDYPIYERYGPGSRYAIDRDRYSVRYDLDRSHFEDRYLQNRYERYPRDQYSGSRVRFDSGNREDGRK